MTPQPATEIKTELTALAEPKYQAFASRLLPRTENILGVRVPTLRAIAKREAKKGWTDYLKTASDDTFEEIMLQGLIIATANATPEEICRALDDFVPKINNWSVCDSTAMTIRAVKKSPATFYTYAEKCIKKGTEFSVRFGLVLMIGHFINDDYYQQILDLLNQPAFPGHYAEMAAAWAVSDIYVKYPTETEKWLKTCSLRPTLFNKAIQKIKESYRADPAAKKRLDQMKR